MTTRTVEVDRSTAAAEMTLNIDDRTVKMSTSNQHDIDYNNTLFIRIIKSVHAESTLWL